MNSQTFRLLLIGMTASLAIACIGGCSPNREKTEASINELKTEITTLSQYVDASNKDVTASKQLLQQMVVVMQEQGNRIKVLEGKLANRSEPKPKPKPTPKPAKVQPRRGKKSR